MCLLCSHLQNASRLANRPSVGDTRPLSVSMNATPLETVQVESHGLCHGAVSSEVTHVAARVRDPPCHNAERCSTASTRHLLLARIPEAAS